MVGENERHTRLLKRWRGFPPILNMKRKLRVIADLHGERMEEDGVK
jgi:hypothetical protein